MAILCPTCGREYDVTLFQFGRTISCTCGAHVGLEKRIPFTPIGQEPRFICDAMLGRLARWLRTLGYDTEYDDAIDDAVLVARGREEHRRVLTRDRALAKAWRVDGILVLEADDPMEQLEEVLRWLGLAVPDRLFTRCTVCNTALEPLDPAEARDRVPEKVHTRHNSFAECPVCDRVYWEGSHAQRMRRRLADGLAEGGVTSGPREPDAGP